MKPRLLTAIVFAAFAVLGCQDAGPTDVAEVTPSFARASLTTVSGTLHLDGIGICNDWGTVPSGHYQERNCEAHYTATGDVVAEGWMIEKASFNFVTGNGTASGPMDLTVTEFLGSSVAEGTMSGQVTFNCEGWWCTTNFVLQGGGDLKGLTMRVQAAGWFSFPTSFAYTGTVVNPKGG